MIDAYDILVLVGDKDVPRAHLCLGSLHYLMPPPRGIYVVTPQDRQIWFNAPPGTKVVYLRDTDVLDVKREGLMPNWAWQQCVKLSQNVTELNWYYTVDSDLVFMKPFQVLGKDRGPVFRWYCFATQDYSGMMMAAWGQKKVMHRSMVCHQMMFNKGYCRELMDRFLALNPLPQGETDAAKHLYRWVSARQNPNLQMSEFDTYANFVTEFHPGVYETKELFGRDRTVWQKSLSEQEALTLLAQDFTGTGLDVTSVHLRVKEFPD